MENQENTKSERLAPKFRKSGYEVAFITTKKLKVITKTRN